MFKIEITYTSGMEVFDISSSGTNGEVRGPAQAIIEALRLSNLKDRKTGCYRTVINVKVVSHTFVV